MWQLLALDLVIDVTARLARPPGRRVCLLSNPRPADHVVVLHPRMQYPRVPLQRAMGRWQDVAVPALDLAATQRAKWDLLRDYLSSYAERRPIRKVTVVGNAPVLPDPDRVEDIQSSDLVIRVNSLALDEPGGPPCVGTRCNVLITSRYAQVTPWTFRDYKRRAYLIPQAGFGVRSSLMPQPLYWPSDLGALPIPYDPVVAELKDLLDPEHQPGKLIPTSGTLACYLAHELFPTADFLATGFSFLDGVQQEAWRYQSGGGSPVIPQHRLDLEGALLRSWIADGSLRVHL